jgi:GTP-binding protein
MLIDDITITIEAGKGGDGKACFNKTKMSLGPTGGDGGNGGSVYVEGVSDIGALGHFRHKKKFSAKNGKNGMEQLKHGEDGQDLVLKVPVGTSIHIDGKVFDLLKLGEKMLLVKGGKGGKGNYHFRSPSNTTPKEWEKGEKGELKEVRFELKLIADIGLVGFPNAGKSSFINIVTEADSKVANYPFTTLEPHLGVYYDLIIADIPGLIEGASQGKGLGIKFLRHIERTRIIFHFVSVLLEDVVGDYRIIRKELESHSKDFLKKKEYVFLTRADEVSKEDLNKKIQEFQSIGIDAIPFSVIDDESIEKVKILLNKIQKEK